MARLPFKLSTPAAQNTNAPGARPSFNQAEAAKIAATEGETLTEVGAEHMQPDGEIGAGAPDQGSEDGARPAYKPAIPWPAAKAVSHKPFKI
jgi:hypothetical protein